ncbi:hypothetical protein, partial [Sphingomonas sp. CFBP 8765]|uniref:hypothetical protein n=1 Tax=Sphingomonas sp. CFBP 8765 TaxID=2775274 RepID=UPI001A7E3D4A
SRSFYNIAPIFRFKIKKTHNRSFSGCKAVPNFGHSFMLVTGGPTSAMGCGPNKCRKAATVGISVSTVRLVALEAALLLRKQASRRLCLAATKALWTDFAAPARR